MQSCSLIMPFPRRISSNQPWRNCAVIELPDGAHPRVSAIGCGELLGIDGGVRQICEWKMDFLFFVSKV